MEICKIAGLRFAVEWKITINLGRKYGMKQRYDNAQGNKATEM